MIRNKMKAVMKVVHLDIQQKEKFLILQILILKMQLN